MKDKLSDLLKNSYSPYSNFKVAAIAITKDGREFNGVNVENASYGATICAERNAILSAISNGYKKGDFREIHLLCDSEKIGLPCFSCRAVISELCDQDCLIIAYNNKGDIEKHTVSELCPYPFNKENLK